MAQTLKPEQLRFTFDCDSINCETTADLVRETTIIGQKRGVQAIEFGIGLKSPGYNIFVTGESGTGRTTAIKRFVEQRAAHDPVPDDWIYVHNFTTAHKPTALRVPAGRGGQLRGDLDELIGKLRSDPAPRHSTMNHFATLLWKSSTTENNNTNPCCAASRPKPSP